MQQKDWTIMIYLAGDNNLAVDMAYALEQIKSLPFDPENGPNIFVYYDGSSREIPTLYCDFTDPRNPVYQPAYQFADRPYQVPRRGNENAADVNSIYNFVDWCVNGVEVVGEDGTVSNGRRSRRYGLVFSGHSLGFQDIGLFKDESAGKTLTMKGLYECLSRITMTGEQLVARAAAKKFRPERVPAETKVLLGQKFDLLGFDSCLMGMLEVGYQFTGIADVLIASEGNVPSAGWTYARILGNLTNGASKSTGDIAEGFVRDFIASQDAYTIGGVSVDMAAWDLSKLQALGTAFDGLAKRLIEGLEKQDVGAELMERAILSAHWRCQSFMFDQSVDLADFCELLDEECGLIGRAFGVQHAGVEAVRNATREVVAKLREAVLLSGFSGGAYQFANGISVFFPWSYEAFAASEENYSELAFVRGSEARKFDWNGFLRLYLSNVARRRAVGVGELPDGRYRYQSGITFAVPRAHGASAGFDHKVGGIEGAKVGGIDGAKVGGIEGAKVGGIEGAKVGGIEGAKVGGIEGAKVGGIEGAKVGGIEGAKVGGIEGAKVGGIEGAKVGGIEGAKVGGIEGAKVGGIEGAKVGGIEGAKVGGIEGAKVGGIEGAKVGGIEGAKVGGIEGAKVGGIEGAKVGGIEGAKVGGIEGAKVGGIEGAKMGGPSGGVFSTLRLFKNVESRWNVSGFSRRPKRD